MTVDEYMGQLLSKVWDYMKRAFGRSRTIALNVLGALSIVFVEMSSYLLSFNWDDLFKHEVALAIGLAVQVFNVILRLNTVAPVNFGKLPADSNGACDDHARPSD